jgi:hypothetical protein
MNGDVKDPWEEIRFMTMDGLVTFTKLHGSAFSMRGWTTPEGWPFTVMIAVGSPGNEALPQALLDTVAALASLKAAVVNPASPVQKPTPQRSRSTCNRHYDCDGADAEARARHGRAADHCHDECCEDCFGQ